MTTIAGWTQLHNDLSRLDREVLLMDALAKNRAYLIAHPEHPIDNATGERLQAAVTRLRAGEPIAYIRGWKEFCGLRFEVSQAVLVPRPETELLVELVLREAEANWSVLDLGTGSGAIALSIAHTRPELSVVATDISLDALFIARKNAMRLAPHVQFCHGDWFSAASKTFDIVVSNPPYIGESEPALTALLAEPRGALVSGCDGLSAIRIILSTAVDRCRRMLFLEHGATQGEAVRSLFARAGFREVRTERDLAGLDRVTWGRLS
jgi:release factor glutamine methyltransferase